MLGRHLSYQPLTISPLEELLSHTRQIIEHSSEKIHTSLKMVLVNSVLNARTLSFSSAMVIRRRTRNDTAGLKGEMHVIRNGSSNDAIDQWSLGISPHEWGEIHSQPAAARGRVLLPSPRLIGKHLQEKLRLPLQHAPSIAQRTRFLGSFCGRIGARKSLFVSNRWVGVCVGGASGIHLFF